MPCRVVLIILLLSHAAQAAEPVLERNFTQTVRPFLNRYCIGCHSGETPAAQFDLKSYSTIETVVRDYPRWNLVLEKLTAKAAKLESACASDIKKYCTTVTPGEGRMIYCMQAHEDKISPKCAFELEDAAASVQTTADALKDAILACKAEINGVCGKIAPGQGRVATCLLENKSTASSGCADAIKKIETMAAQ